MSVGLGKAFQAELKARLKKAFPDARIDDSDVEGFALAVQRRLPEDEEAAIDKTPFAAYRDRLDALAASSAPPGVDPQGRSRVPRHGDATEYYWAIARHTRHTEEPQRFDPFDGQLAMVRVRLPEREPRRFSTRIGTVEPGDHLLATIYQANDKFAVHLGFELQRVDMITPPRQLLRFGAISVLLGYKRANELPTCYILEAGTAIGEPKVLFLGKTLASLINRRSGYKPTEFSCSDNAYTGQLTVDGHEPKRLRITARDIIGNASAPPYLTVDVAFQKQTGNDVDSIWPGWLIARAALIIESRSHAGLENTCEDT